jgi:hypothetical protein
VRLATSRRHSYRAPSEGGQPVPWSEGSRALIPAEIGGETDGCRDGSLIIRFEAGEGGGWNTKAAPHPGPLPEEREKGMPSPAHPYSPAKPERGKLETPLPGERAG